MDLIRGILSTGIGGMLLPFSGHDAMLSLVPLSIAVGIGTLWVFRRISNPDAIRKSKAQMQAHLYELRLFSSEPALIWQAQWGLLKANAQYIAMMLRPALVMTIPLILLFAQMECFYGMAPLAPGQETVVTIEMTKGPSGPTPILRAPQSIVVESPAVRVDGGRQISWRIRALRPVNTALHFVFPNQTVEKSITAGTGPQYLSERRVSSVVDLIWFPGESRLQKGPIDWIELRYARATVHALGFDLHWLVWLMIFSMLTVLIFRRWFGINF